MIFCYEETVELKPPMHPTSSPNLSNLSEKLDKNSIIRPKIFYEKADRYVYNCRSDSLQTALHNTCRVYFPLETDTEYYHLDLDVNHPTKEITRCLTIQHRAIDLDSGLIFTHPDSQAFARHPLATSGFTPVDYLQSLGYKASLERSEYPLDLPILQIDLYGFFLIAELYRVVQGDFREDINKLVLGRNDFAFIHMDRRLKAELILKGNRAEQFVLMPWVVTIDGLSFQVAISLFDTCAVHGTANYASFCSNSGVNLLYKDNFSFEEKCTMDNQYINRPEDFDNYALGDLYNYQALMGNMSKFDLIYNALGIEDYFEPPRLTIGATVARIVRSSMLKFLGLDIKEKNKVIELCRYGTSAYIKTLKTSTAIYNAKVDGGRCRNNRPTDVSVHKPIADVDIAGCYGNGLKNQNYPFGRPIIIQYPIKSDKNNCYSLRKFLKTYRKQLVPGLWQARVSTPKGYELKYDQDFLMSWIPPKDPSKMPSDTDLASIDWYDEDNIGIVKIFTNQVNLAIITEEFIDWLDNTASTRQRAELLDKLEVQTAMFYPKDEECNDVIEFFNSIQSHKGENLSHAVIKRRRSKTISIEQECHSWISVNLGELLVSQLLTERGKYSKSDPEQKPLNELYKLCINTIYGDMVSTYFDIGNVVVGNNITARARAMAWYMEKGLNGFQTITDGCAFELNRAIHPDKTKLTSETVLATSSITAHYKVRPIDGYDRIDVYETEQGLGLNLITDNTVKTLNNSEAKEWLAEAVSNHLVKSFPNVPVIQKFQFEIKDIYDAGSFHGTANYKFRKVSKTEQGKMRSYSKKDCYNAYTLSLDELQILRTEYKPSEEFLEALILNPSNVPRSHPYIQTKILKTSEYKAHYESKWSKSEAFPGCTIENGRMLRECSLTQFTFRTFKQFQSWEREAKRLMLSTGQTYESWFLDDEGLLDFKGMCIALNKLIRGGEMRFSSSRSTSLHRNLSREYEFHENYPALELIKRQLKVRYGFIPDDNEEVIDVHVVDEGE